MANGYSGNGNFRIPGRYFGDPVAGAGDIDEEVIAVGTAGAEYVATVLERFDLSGVTGGEGALFDTRESIEKEASDAEKLEKAANETEIFDANSEATAKTIEKSDLVDDSDSGGGGGGSPSPPGGGQRDSVGDPVQVPLGVTPGVRARTIVENNSASSVYCDDEPESGPQSEIFVGGTGALPIPQPSSADTNVGFINTEDYGINRTVGGGGVPSANFEFREWFTDSYFKHNKMIPAQFYYQSYMDDTTGTVPYDIRSHVEQTLRKHNLGSNAARNENLNDNLRYVVGCNWENSSIRSGLSSTALEIAALWREFDPTAQNLLNSCARRGIYFIPNVPLPLMGNLVKNELSNNGRTNYLESELISYPGLPLRYGTSVTLVSNMTNLLTMKQQNSIRQMQSVSPITYENITTYLNYLATEKENENFSGGTNLPEEGRKYHYDHCFRAPAGYGYRESRDRDGIPEEQREKDSVAIRTYSRFKSNLISSETKKEENIKSVYRAYREANEMEYDMPIFNADNGEPLGSFITFYEPLKDENYNRSRQSCDGDQIQKFPASQVEEINRINDLIFTNGDDLFSGVQYQLLDGEPYEDPSLARVTNRVWVDRHMDSYNIVEFKMNHSSKIAALFAASGLDTYLLEMIDLLSPYRPTNFVQILDRIGAPTEEGLAGTSKDLVAINVRPNEVRNPMVILERMLFRQSIYNHGRFQPETYIDHYTYPLAFNGIAFNNDEPPAGTSFGQQLFSRFFVNIGSDYVISETPGLMPNPEQASFLANLGQLLNKPDLSRHRKGEQILGGSPCFSEVLAYRVVKIDSETGQTIQEYLFANNNLVDQFRFVDNQVIPGKRYKYKIFTINFVAGSKYTYNFEDAKIQFPNMDTPAERNPRRLSSQVGQRLSPSNVDETKGFYNLPFFGDKEILFDEMFGINIPMDVASSYRIIEAPYYEKEIITDSNDRPPIYPDVQVLKSYRDSTSTHSSVMIYPYPRIGITRELPIMMEEQDEQMLEKMYLSQDNSDSQYSGDEIVDLGPDRLRTIEYRTDSKPSLYEMFYVMQPPVTGMRFLSENGKKISTSKEKEFFDFDIPYNTKIYITFRAVDNAGFSNPSPIYVLTRHNYGDGEYTTFEPYEVPAKKLEIKCKRMISINPSIEQKVFTIYPRGSGIANQQPLDNPEDLFSSAPRLNDVTLGTHENNTPSTEKLDDSLWGQKRNFKFRFTSLSSGNSFDINLNFNLNKVDLLSNTSAEQDSEECEDISDKEREKTKKTNQRRTVPNLNNPRDEYDPIIPNEGNLTDEPETGGLITKKGEPEKVIFASDEEADKLIAAKKAEADDTRSIARGGQEGDVPVLGRGDEDKAAADKAAADKAASDSWEAEAYVTWVDYSRDDSGMWVEVGDGMMARHDGYRDSTNADKAAADKAAADKAASDSWVAVGDGMTARVYSRDETDAEIAAALKKAEDDSRSTGGGSAGTWVVIDAKGEYSYAMSAKMADMRTIKKY